MLRVLVNGADGRMGSQVVKAVFEDPELTVAGGVSITHVGEDVGEVAGVGHLGLAIEGDFAKALEDIKPDVVVDFTTPAVIFKNAKTCIAHGVNMVVGTTGLTAEQRHELHALALEKKTSIFIAPNFSIGAVLMMKLSTEVAPYLPDVEIIELHHNNKLDAPSGTAIMTADKIDEARKAAGAQPRRTRPMKAWTVPVVPPLPAFPFTVSACRATSPTSRSSLGDTASCSPSVTIRSTVNLSCPASS